MTLTSQLFRAARLSATAATASSQGSARSRESASKNDRGSAAGFWAALEGTEQQHVLDLMSDNERGEAGEHGLRTLERPGECKLVWGPCVAAGMELVSTVDADSILTADDHRALALMREGEPA